MHVQPKCLAVPFNKLEKGKLIHFVCRNRVELALTVEKPLGNLKVDVILLLSKDANEDKQYMLIDGEQLEAAVAVVYDEYILDLATDQNKMNLSTSQSPKKGSIFLIDDEPALCSYLPGRAPTVFQLHKLRDGTHQSLKLQRTARFDCWSILLPMADSPPRVLFQSA